MAVRGGSSIVRTGRTLARLVKRHTAAGALAYGASAPAVAALVLLSDIFIALDAAGAFDGVMTGSFAVMAAEPEMSVAEAAALSRQDALNLLVSRETSVEKV